MKPRGNLDLAHAIAPTERRLWSGYASIAQGLGKPSEVVKDMQQELKLHPDEVELYPKLYMLQSRDNDTKGALLTVRSWVRAAPSYPQATVALVTQLRIARLNAERSKVCQSSMKRFDHAEAASSGLLLSCGADQASQKK